MAATKKIHPADQMDRDAIATATSFNTFFRQSPTAKINRPAKTLEGAIGHFDNIVAELKMDGRKGKITPIIYAIQSTGAQSPVAADIVEGIRAGKTLADFGIGAPAPLDIAAEVAKVAGMTDEEVKATTKANKAKRRAHLSLVADANAAAKPPKAAKAPRAAKAPAEKAPGKRAAAEAAAAAGTLPAQPDFTAETHKRFRGKLAEVVALVEAKDIKGLEGFAINPISSSPKAIDRYRNLAVIALKAQAAK